MSDIRFNQWLHNSGTGGVSQVDGGHVGIGTTNPLIPVGSGNTAILNVGVVTANSFYGDASNLTGVVLDKIIEGNTQVETVDTGSNGHIKFTTEGNEKLRITSAGLVGIGTDNPAKKLEVFDNTHAVARIRGGAGGSNSSRKAELSLFASGAREYVIRADAADAAFKIYDASDGNADRLYINSSGSLGLNLSTPKTTKGIHISKGTGNGAAPNSYSLANEYLHFGFSEYNPSGNRGLFAMGFGYVAGSTNATKSPAYLGFNEETDGGYTKGSLVFATRNVVTDTSPTERLRIGPGGGHYITCEENHYSANLSEMTSNNLAINIGKTRSGYTKGIGIGAVGTSDQNTGIQAYDSSNNSANPLMLNPFGGKVNIGCPDNGTANAGLNVEDSTNNSTNTLKLINKPSGANGKARLEFYTETSAGQGASPYIMSVCGTDAFGSNSANDGGLQFHTRHGGSGTDVNALELSNKGYVLKPQHPYFKANLASNVRITGTGDVTFGAVVHNNGGHYDSSNGRFYAPIAGLYWFSCRINAYDRIDFKIRVNGTEVERGQYNTDNDQVGWWSNQLTTITYMTAGQYANVYVSNLDQNTDPDKWCTFMGYLVC